MKMKISTVICLTCAAVNIPFMFGGSPFSVVSFIICMGCAMGTTLNN